MLRATSPIAAVRDSDEPSRIWPVAALLALAACGGGEPISVESQFAARSERERISAIVARTEQVAVTAAASGAKKDSAAPPAAGAIRYDLRLYDENGRAAPTFELAPVAGRGYQTVRVHVVVRGPRVISPVSNVQAYCATPARCEYLPPRNGDRALKYTVSIGDDSLARLSPTRDLIAVTARQLKVEQVSIVNVTLTVDGQPPVTKQIKYLRPPT